MAKRKKLPAIVRDTHAPDRAIHRGAPEPSTSLNGFWERGRRLLRLFGQSWDSRVQPVIIVEDSRSPGGLPDSYRRFGLWWNQAIAINSCTKIRCDAELGCVITGIFVGYDAPAAQSGSIRLMTAAQALLGPPTWQALGANWGGAYADNPAAGLPPFSGATDGTFNAGNLYLPLPRDAGHFRPITHGIFLPKGAGINFHATGTALTNAVIGLQGYLR